MVLKIKFTSPLHIGGWRDDITTSTKVLHSDVLYSAVFSVWAKYGHADWIADAVADKSFAITSAFPYLTEGAETVFYLPKPFVSLSKPKDPEGNHIEMDAGKDRKALKKMAYISAQDYKAWAEADKPDLVPTIDKVNGEFYCSKSKPTTKKVFSTELQHRVSLALKDEETNEPVPFDLERLYLNPNVGLYVKTEGAEQTLTRFNQGLKWLGQEGIGTDRCTGNGYFEVELHAGIIPWPKVDKPKRIMMLGLMIPEKDETSNQFQDLFPKDASNTGYDLKRRGGWLTSDSPKAVLKDSVYMVVEGSVALVPNASITPIGTIVDLSTNLPKDLKPDHPIYRVGRVLTYPINH